MFEIVVTGPAWDGALMEDIAYAETPEDALLAARTLWDQVYDQTLRNRATRKAMLVRIWNDDEFVALVEGERP